MAATLVEVVRHILRDTLCGTPLERLSATNSRRQGPFWTTRPRTSLSPSAPLRGHDFAIQLLYILEQHFLGSHRGRPADEDDHERGDPGRVHRLHERAQPLALGHYQVTTTPSPPVNDRAHQYQHRWGRQQHLRRELPADLHRDRVRAERGGYSQYFRDLSGDCGRHGKNMQVGATPFQVLDWATYAAEEAHARGGGGAGITPRGWHNCTTSWSKPRRGWRPCCGTSRGGPPADVHLHVEQIENFRMPPTTTWPRSTYGKPSPCSRGAPGGTEHGDVPPHQVDKRTLEANLLAASGEGDEHSDLP